ncbi:MAG: hypothetical protein AAGC57_07240 [Pseudomonadota bacterium]
MMSLMLLPIVLAMLVVVLAFLGSQGTASLIPALAVVAVLAGLFLAVIGYVPQLDDGMPVPQAIEPLPQGFEPAPIPIPVPRNIPTGAVGV